MTIIVAKPAVAAVRRITPGPVEYAEADHR